MRRIDYTKRFKAISSYVDFAYKPRGLTRLSLKAKRKITKYYKYVRKLKARPYQVYKTKSQKRLKTAQEYSGQNSDKFPHLKVAFIPKGRDKVQVSFKKGKISVKEKYLEATDVKFDTQALIKDPEAETKRAISGVRAKGFTVMAAEFEIPSGYNRTTIVDKIAQLCQTYGAGELRGGINDNHHFKNWLFGVRAYNFRKQGTFRNFINDKKEFIEEQKRIKKNKRKGLTHGGTHQKPKAPGKRGPKRRK